MLNKAYNFTINTYKFPNFINKIRAFDATKARNLKDILQLRSIKEFSRRRVNGSSKAANEFCKKEICFHISSEPAIKSSLTVVCLC